MMNCIRHTLLASAVVVLVTGLFAAAPAAAQGYPRAPVRMILPFPAGSSTDLMFRTLAGSMEKGLGQKVIIDPKPGAGTILAVNELKKAAPDGYTLIITTSSMAIQSALANAPFDIRKDMTHIVPVNGGAFVYATNADVPAKTLQEFVAYAKSRPGQLNFDSYGNGTLGHLAVEMLIQVAGLTMTHVPYGGAPASALALSKNDTQIGVNNPTLLAPHIKSGRIVVLCQTAAERTPTMPDVPSTRECGFPSIDLTFWQGIAGPAGLSRDVLDRIGAAANDAGRQPEFIEINRRTGAYPTGGTPEKMVQLVTKDVAAYAKLIQDAKLKLE